MPARSLPGLLVAVCSVFIITAAHATAAPAAQQKLIFSDEFDGATLDRAKWVTQYWHGRTNPPEVQYYADDVFHIEDGILHIRARKLGAQQAAVFSTPDASVSYASGLISTDGKFTFRYGTAEMRAKVPRGKGLWPAFWLLSEGTALRPEIDVMEMLGHQTNRVHMTLHMPDASSRDQQARASFRGPDFAHDFHIFSVQWSPDAIIWRIDGVERFSVRRNIPQVPMYLIANLAVGGAWPGAPDRTTPQQASFDIDYIRVYQDAISP